ncbi:MULTISPECIES: hypothetical protein [Mycolicibacter]|uniref:Uncharacterized protein n=1 Tax=Mycolicibacter longobardus TaxID=1108812 RepID=A0A1X1YBW3_9MYCO|nr:MULTISPECIES: hypothetical protein [Mycolicibacter]ORW08524.1 hypothetical protein AWC16_19185 [Mycolicibacter longobardus]RAV04365.1 hypothetical protein DQP56_00675 [Mycolicibacter senuensis]
MRYRVKVNELRNHEVIYEVDAANPAEAQSKAAIGDTVNEVDTGRFEVTDRFVDDVEAIS